MWFKLTSYLKFLTTSTNQHGVHSPFVYHLVTQCFYTNTSVQKTIAFQKIKQSLFKNKKAIEVTDFGQGSKVFKNNVRKIADIAKVAGITQKRALLLIRIVEYFQIQNVLEIGTSVGLSTSALSIGNPKANITTLEGCKNTANAAEQLFQKFNLQNIVLITGNFNSTLPKIIKNNVYDMIYFDGNHQKEATINYFKICLKSIHNNSVFIFDDINWSQEMQQAWQEIIKHPQVTVTINTFYWGFVFFRKEQKKQHFTIRV
ncbi:O-methyltransferase [Lutibacter sp.]|uniref:O-methyltransferase n=1 Tax=Lutibacter sp. TaxID=1925666 RepID=UPI003569567C